MACRTKYKVPMAARCWYLPLTSGPCSILAGVVQATACCEGHRELTAENILCQPATNYLRLVQRQVVQGFESPVRLAGYVCNERCLSYSYRKLYSNWRKGSQWDHSDCRSDMAVKTGHAIQRRRGKSELVCDDMMVVMRNIWDIAVDIILKVPRND